MKDTQKVPTGICINRKNVWKFGTIIVVFFFSLEVGKKPMEFLKTFS